MTDLKWLIKEYMTRLRIEDFKTLAKMCGIDYQTFQRRIKHPENFRMFELRAINDILHFESEDLIKIFSLNN